MKKINKLFLLLALILAPALHADAKRIKLDPYGFVRGDFYYNSRENADACQELFYLYPLDVRPDANGADLNANPSLGVQAFVSRLGVDVKGARLGKANVTAKIEMDFAGFGEFNSMLRIRQAYFNLAWKSGSSLLVGQTWHPLFGSVAPFVMNLSTGSPFQPFNRSPQVQYNYRTGNWRFLAAAISQLQYTSAGEDGYSPEYSRQSCLPELYLGFDWANNGWLIGGGADLLTLKPRTEAEHEGATYKVDESLTALSGELHANYVGGKFRVAAKTMIASALDNTLLLGGYGITSISTTNGERKYAPMHHSTSWLNVTYGNTWRPFIYVGYTKNLGTSDPLVSAITYGRGLNIDQLLGLSGGLSYNSKVFTIGIEYSAMTASYGSLDMANGRVVDTHNVTNHRIAAISTFYF